CPVGGFQPARLVGSSWFSCSSQGCWPFTAELTRVVRCSSTSTTLPSSWSAPLGLHTTLQQARNTASAPHPTQTVLGLAKHTGSSVYQWREVVVAPDGVELLLDFKAPAGHSQSPSRYRSWSTQPVTSKASGQPCSLSETPIVFILHGIGGGSESRLARLLSDAAVARGWRAVVYNRRGHGESTLLPASLHPVKKSRPSSGTRSPTQGGLPSQPLSAQQVAAALSAATSAAAASLVRLASSARGSRTSVPSGPCTQEAAAQELASQPAKLQPFHNTVSAGIPSSTCTQGDTPAEGPAPQAEGPDRAAEVQRKQSLMQSMCKVFPRHSDVDDLAAVAQHLAQLFPTAPKLALGFSQGSNVLCHYLGLHANDPPPFTAAISVSNAFDLVTGTAALHLDWVTDALITRPLKRLLRKELAAVTELKEARNLQLDLVKALSTHHVREFDQALLVPAFGFGSVDEYYHTQSCKDVLMDIRTPLLLLNNLDDPVIPPALSLLGQEAASRNPALIAVCTKRGGHLGWLQVLAALPALHTACLMPWYTILSSYLPGASPLVPHKGLHLSRTSSGP
ncbi:hypothetical protein QJQ45_019962, partial [Haematococcus lacustris]